MIKHVFYYCNEIVKAQKNQKKNINANTRPNNNNSRNT